MIISARDSQSPGSSIAIGVIVSLPAGTAGPRAARGEGVGETTGPASQAASFFLLRASHTANEANA